MAICNKKQINKFIIIFDSEKAYCNSKNCDRISDDSNIKMTLPYEYEYLIKSSKDMILFSQTYSCK